MIHQVNPIRVGLVGTGYAARKRAEAIVEDERSHFVALWGSQSNRVQELAQLYNAEAISTYEELVERPDLDLIVVSTKNHLHGAIAQAALKARKHVIVEYPLALTIDEAKHVIHLAKQQQQLLHVEHIELLSGIHHILVENLPSIGRPFYARSISLRAEQSIQTKWSYHLAQAGFPLMSALSRIQRLVTLWGEVKTVSCQSRFWGIDGRRSETPNYHAPYRSCLCSAQLRFTNGLIADVVYGKGVDIWKTERSLEIHGEAGMIHLEGSQGYIINNENHRELTVGSRRGLFAKDTRLVLDSLIDSEPLYVTPEQSLYALIVADGARRSAKNNELVHLDASHYHSTCLR